MTARCHCGSFIKAHLSECGRCFLVRSRQGITLDPYRTNSNQPPAPKPAMVMSDYTGKPIMSFEAPTTIDPLTAAMWRGMCDCCPDEAPVPADAANAVARREPLFRTRWWRLKGRI